MKKDSLATSTQTPEKSPVVKRRTVYERFVEENAKSDLDVNYAVVAINGEAGEIAEWHKKYNLRGNPKGKYTEEDLKLELGDVLYYVTRLANLMGWTMEEVQQANIDKLMAKKGDGLRKE